MSDTTEAERRTNEAFERATWRDPRADYRSLLRALKQQDAALYDAAVRLYRDAVQARLEEGAADPVVVWLEYGIRLAELAGGGRTMVVDESGRSSAVAQLPVEPALLIHLPAEESRAAIVVAVPREPSPAQRATLALLAEGRQALPA